MSTEEHRQDASKAQAEWEERRKARKERQQAAREAKVKREEGQEDRVPQNTKGRGIRSFTEDEKKEMKERFSDANRRKSKRARRSQRKTAR
jgi:hypothetical protein